VLSALFLSGCAFLRPTDNEVNTADKARIIHNTAREGVVLAINKLYEDSVSERVMAAGKLKHMMDGYVLPLLNNPDKEITVALEKEIMDVIPEEWKGLMAAAYETLHLYYEFPATSEVLPEPYLTYLKAFCNGAREGAQKILKQEGVQENVILLLPEPEDGE
jgi:hypothetical protein